MFDQASDIKMAPSLHASLSADTNGAGVDRTGYEACTVAVHLGVQGVTLDGTNYIDIELEHSDDGSAWTDVEAKDVVMPTGESLGANGRLKRFNAAHAAISARRYGYIGDKKHVRGVANFEGTHGTATPVCISMILSRGVVKPVANP